MSPDLSPPLPAADTRHGEPARLVFAAGVLGTAWNLFGIVQWVSSLRADEASLVAGGLSPAQAALMASLPAWMDAAFGVGVLAGLLGCLALLRRDRRAPALLGVSLLAYGVLFAGDAALGVFAALPAQLAVLSAVVLIAAGLLAVARQARARGALR